MRFSRRAPRAAAALAVAALGVALVAGAGRSAAGTPPQVTAKVCAARPWMQSSYQEHSTPAALAATVLSCLKLRFPASYRHDEVGLVALNSYPWFQNVNEFGLTSTVQQQVAALGIPPITLEDGPGGLITKTSPSPTQLPNDLALGATFNTSLATLYGDVLGAQAHAMGYDGVQAPELNLLRVPTWGRAAESFGESAVLAGEMGAAEALAIENHGEIAVLKHFGPYSQDTNRRFLNQVVTTKALEEVYTRPFTIALRALAPVLQHGGHAVGVMCSYGNVNSLKACRSPLLTDELDAVGVNALVRSDLDVEVNPSALVTNGVDLVKPMDTGELVASLHEAQIDHALDDAVLQIFETEFADGLVNGTTAAHARHLSFALSRLGDENAMQIEEHAEVLLKDASGTLPLAHGGRVAVVTDGTLPNTCNDLAASLARALSSSASCTIDSKVALPHTALFGHLYGNHAWVTRSTTFVAPSGGPYELAVTTFGNTKVAIDGHVDLSTLGLAEFAVQRSALVSLAAGRHTVTVTYKGAPPKLVMTPLGAEVRAAVRGASGARVAIVVAYDLDREGMDRDSLELPNGQDAVIAALAAKMPTVVLLATDGPVTMPWLGAVKGVLQVWSPTWLTNLDRVQSAYVPAWTAVLDGDVDPSGRLPVTFPVTTAQSPAGVASFWPGIGTNVNLDAPPDGGVGIGMAWYREAGWPVLFPFGYGLSYTTFQIEGGTVQSGPSGLTMTVAVRDTGTAGGEDPVQVYANWPSSASEPRLQLVGFGVASFTKAQAGTTVDVTIPLSRDALSVYARNAMSLLSGSYCFEAASYDGDPHAMGTGSVGVSTSDGGTQLSVASADPLTSAPCPA